MHIPTYICTMNIRYLVGSSRQEDLEYALQNTKIII